VPGNTTLDAVATIRDAIAHAEYTNTTLCIFTLDFKNAFDRIAQAIYSTFSTVMASAHPSSLLSEICTMALLQLCRSMVTPMVQFPFAAAYARVVL
jgi:hypothetical protein